MITAKIVPFLGERFVMILCDESNGLGVTRDHRDYKFSLRPAIEMFAEVLAVQPGHFFRWQQNDISSELNLNIAEMEHSRARIPNSRNHDFIVVGIIYGKSPIK